MQRTTVIVTGGGRGLGQAAALELARQGAGVLVVDLGVSKEGFDPDPRPAEEVAGEIRASAGRAQALAADVGCEDGVVAAFDLAERELGPVDGLIHAAGIVPVVSIAGMSAEVFDRTLAVHLRGAFLLCREALRRMSRGGSVLLVTSGAGIDHTYPGVGAYSAAKAGMIGLLRVAAEEGRPSGVTVIGLAPILRSRMSGGRVAEESILEPEEAAAVAAALLTTDAAFLSGKVVRAQRSGLSLAAARTTEWLRPGEWTAGDIQATLLSLTQTT